MTDWGERAARFWKHLYCHWVDLWARLCSSKVGESAPHNYGICILYMHGVICRLHTPHGQRESVYRSAPICKHWPLFCGSIDSIKARILWIPISYWTHTSASIYVTKWKISAIFCCTSAQTHDAGTLRVHEISLSRITCSRVLINSMTVSSLYLQIYCTLGYNSYHYLLCYNPCLYCPWAMKHDSQYGIEFNS